MDSEQYFSAHPQSNDARHHITVTLRGNEYVVEVAGGVFSENRLDLGTSVLLKDAPIPPATGNLLDLGCGWGPISLALAHESPAATVWALDINERALELTAKNAALAHISNIHAATAEQLPADIEFDTIWSNPPIRIGKSALHELLMAYLPRLAAGGYAYLVVQRNLGSDSLIPWLSQALGDGFTVSKYSSSKGYRVIEVHRLP
jgi:16S rRNA G1207 methylase RsmC